MTVIVDTNVAVVASKDSDELSEDDPSMECVTTCVERLEQINNDEMKLVLDRERRIIDEYRRNLESMNRFSMGFQFYRWVERNWTNPERCDLVEITPVIGLEINFEEFPNDPALKKFDDDDRKFIAVACAHRDRPPILQAVDGKWRDFLDALHENGVTVEYLCEDDRQ